LFLVCFWFVFGLFLVCFWFVFGLFLVCFCGRVLVEWTAGFDIRGAKGKEDVLNPVSLMGDYDVMSGEYVISPITPSSYRIGFYLI
jgi:hypothetical protein